MTVRFFRLIAGFVALLQLSSTPLFSAAAPPDSCSNPVLVGSLIVTNSVCGDSTGVILLNIAGGNGGCTFEWQPNVSNTNVAFGLKAAAYHIRVTRLSDPDCVLDTTVIVNNSNGPSVQVQEVLPSNCLASNGKVALAPASLIYVWSNGESGAVNSELLSQCYIVTATDAATSCYSVLRVCVPNVNPLQTSFDIIEPAKCDQPAGVAEVTVTGGSGNYDYSFGDSAIVSNLAPGVYTFDVSDNVTGCLASVTVTMVGGPLKGEVNITPFHIKCPGVGAGNVEFEVVPGSNFKMPFTFALWDENGDPQSPGNLAAGTYFLQIADADSCLLPVETFEILEPPAFSATTTVQAASCNAGGQIQLDLNGGNGRYIIDWSDLPGFNNPRNRLNLEPGFYSAVVYDSLFCAYPVNAVLVPGYCDVPDTLTLIVPVNGVDSLCLAPPVGVDVATLSFSTVNLTEGFGDWFLTPSGCAVYQAGSVAKFDADLICVAVKSATTGLSDTVCVRVNITTVPPEKDSVYFAVQTNNSATACGYVPPNFNNRVVSLLDGQGLNGTSDAFGAYEVDPQSACLTFSSFGQTGYNVDEIRVGVCDDVLRQCRVICYFPTVLSPNDCRDGISLPDSLTLTTADCDAGASTCLPIPFAQIFDYAILDNGLAYSSGQFESCNTGPAVAYAVKLDGGPYQLDEWTVGGDVFSGFFTDQYELLGLLNQFDPVPGWSLEQDSIFVGGDLAQIYGLMKITSAQGQLIEAAPGQKDVPFGTVVHFSAGLHTVIFRRVQTGCLDTVQVKVVCTDCPPVHNYVPNNQGVIALNILQCAGDTLFCTNISGQQVSEYAFSDNGQPFSNLSLCGPNVALRLDTGLHEIRILHNVSFCEYNFKVRLTCSGGPINPILLAVPDQTATLKNTPVEISLVANDIIRGIVGNVDGLDKLDLISVPPNGEVFYDDFLGLVTYTPNDGYCGTDTFSYQITDTAGLRSSAQVRIAVVCDKVLVYNGISPNNDSRNDVWHIIGIEQFPANEVRVFNRWGNLVFEQKGYNNLNAWAGTWNGRDLPDGTYFYLIDLGDGSEVLSGYLQILR